MDEIEIKTQKTVPSTGTDEDFYNKDDSIYIRVQYLPDIDSFRFEVRNAIKKDEQQGIAIQLNTYIRGMLEFALAFPNQTFTLGQRAQEAENIHDNTEGLTDLQKALLEGSHAGLA